MYNETLRQNPLGGHAGLSVRKEAANPPHPYPIVRRRNDSPSPAHYDGLKVIDQHRSPKGVPVLVEMLLKGREYKR